MNTSNLDHNQLTSLLEIKRRNLEEVDELHSQLDSINQKIIELQTSEELNDDIAELENQIINFEGEEASRRVINVDISNFDELRFYRDIVLGL